MLPGVLRALRARGVVVPRELSLVAASDSDRAALAGAAISVERWDSSEFGRTAARLVLDAMRLAPTAGPQRGRSNRPVGQRAQNVVNWFSNRLFAFSLAANGNERATREFPDTTKRFWMKEAPYPKAHGA